MSKKMALLAILAFAFVGTSVKAEVAGTTVEKRVTKVMKTIRWQPDLKSAQEKAKKEKKLVFWMQIVGDLDGGL